MNEAQREALVQQVTDAVVEPIRLAAATDVAKARGERDTIAKELVDVRKQLADAIALAQRSTALLKSVDQLDAVVVALNKRIDRVERGFTKSKQATDDTVYGDTDKADPLRALGRALR